MKFRLHSQFETVVKKIAKANKNHCVINSFILFRTHFWHYQITKTIICQPTVNYKNNTIPIIFNNLLKKIIDSSNFLSRADYSGVFWCTYVTQRLIPKIYPHDWRPATRYTWVVTPVAECVNRGRKRPSDECQNTNTVIFNTVIRAGKKE